MDFGLGSLLGSLFSALDFQRSDQESDQNSQVSPLSSAFNHAAGAGVHLGQMFLPAIVPWLGNYSVLTKTFWSFAKGDEKQGLADLKTLIANLPFGSLTQILDGIYSLTSREDVSSTEALSQIAFGALGLACDVQGFRTAKLSLGKFLDQETARLWNPFHAVRVPHFGREVAGTGMRESDLFGSEVEEAGVLRKIWNALSTSTGGSRRVELPDYLDRKIIEGMYRTQDGIIVGCIHSVHQYPHIKKDEVVIHFMNEGKKIGRIKIIYDYKRGKNQINVISDLRLEETGNNYGFELYANHLRSQAKNQNISSEDMWAKEVGVYLWSHLDGFVLGRESMRLYKKDLRFMNNIHPEWGLNLSQLDTLVSPYDCSEIITLAKPDPGLLPLVRELFPHIKDEAKLLELTRRPGRLALMQVKSYTTLDEDTPNFYANLNFRDREAMRKFELSVREFWQTRGLAPRGSPVVDIS